MVAPVREVELHEVTVGEVTSTELRLSLHCGKGFYVRSFARDLCRALGTLGHVKTLRRTASGAFGLERALYGDGLTGEKVRDRLIPLREACGALRSVELTEEGLGHARHGRPIGAGDVVGEGWRDATQEESIVLFSQAGEPVALARRAGDGLRVVRGFRIPG